MLVGLGEAQRQTGDLSHRETLLEAARLADAEDDVELLVAAVLANTRGFHSVIGGYDEERVAAIDLALRRLPATPTPERARLLALAAAERVFTAPLAERLALAEEALATARASGDRLGLLKATQFLYQTTTHPSTLDLLHRRIEEALDLLDDADDHTVHFGIHTNAATLALQRGDGDAIDAHASVAQALAERSPHSILRWIALYSRGWVAGLRGDLDEYERLAEAALAFALDHGQPDAFTIFGAQLASIRFHQGRLHELIPMIEQTLITSPALYSYRAVLTLAKALLGEVDAARAMLDEDQRAGFPLREDTSWCIGMVSWASAAALAGAPSVAPELRAKLEPYQDQIVTTTTSFSGPVAHYLGLLDHLVGRFDDAERWFAFAVEIEERLRSPVLLAQTQAAWAAMLADRGAGGDHDRARALATAALDAAAAGGYGYSEAAARAVLDRLA